MLNHKSLLLFSRKTPEVLRLLANKPASVGMTSKLFRNYSTQRHAAIEEEIEGEVVEGDNYEPEVVEDSADAFPYLSTFNEEILRDLTEKKRMNKLKEDDKKVSINLNGVFPEMIVDKYFEGDNL